MRSNRWLECPVCNSKLIRYVFSMQGYRIEKCQNCSLMGINPQPDDRKLSEIYNANYFSIGDAADGEIHSRSLKQSTAKHYLSLLDQYINTSKIPLQGRRLLEIGPGYGDFLNCANDLNYEVTGVEYSLDNFNKARDYLPPQVRLICGEISDIKQGEKFDIIVFNDVLEHVRNPRIFLDQVYNKLSDDGVILCVIPSLDSFTAKLQKTNWVEFKLEHLYYFNNTNIKTLVHLSGFGDIKLFPAKKTLSLRYIAEHFKLHKRDFWTPFFAFIKTISPANIFSTHFDIVASGIGVLARKSDFPVTETVSVIMAVYNEAATVASAIESVLSKNIDNCLIDLIIIESNSTDGTKQIVEKYLNLPRVTIIFEDVAKGKGAAIRRGLEVAQGKIILIQDADAEYDIEDYDALIEVLKGGGNTFVLGSRHGGSKWKVRHFEGQPVVAFLANLVHWQLTFLINVLYRVRLTDPFTMYKVFRKSAIKDLNFESNRFDFDYELLLKLIRSGHRPVEIPVNYSARSFKQGKKVRFFRDPLTWVWAILKYRFVDLGQKEDEGR